MNRSRTVVAILAILAVAIALRLGSLFVSPLPYNPDGVIYARYTTDAISLGQLDLSTFATDSLGFTALLTVVSQVTGQPSLYVAQPASAVVGGATVLFAVVFARRLAPAGWTDRSVRLAGFLAGLLAAVDGLYVYRSMATDETTAGLLLLPLLALAAGRTLGTGQRRWAAIAGLIVAFHPPLHNHDGVLGALVLTVAVSYWLITSDRQYGRRVTVAVTVLAVTWVWVVGYHPVAARLTPATVIQTNRLQGAPGLLVAWVVVGVAGVVWSETTSRRLRRTTLLAVVGSWFLLLGLNAAVLVFPGTTPTSTGLLLMLAPLSVVAVLAVLGVEWSLRRRPDGDDLALLALVGGPMILLGFALSAGLTPINLSTAFRTQLYLHVPFMALAAVAFVGLSKQLTPSRRSIRAVAVTALVVCAAVSLPIAFTGLEHRPYETITTTGQFAGTEFAAEHTVGEWTTDDHLRRVTRYHAANSQVTVGVGGIQASVSAASGPLYEWLRDGAPPPDCPVLAQRSWTGEGAQFHPRDPVQVSSARLDGWQATNNVVYAGGATTDITLVRPVTGTDNC